MTSDRAHAAPPLSHLSPRRRSVIYACVLAGLFMAVLDVQIVATALPTIAAELGDLQLFGWVSASYLLATVAVTPFYGKLGDLFGRKRVYMAAIALFVLGSLACGMAWSMQSLIAARALQGLGGGGLMTSAFAIIADLFEPRERARYQGYSSAMFTLAGLCGPLAGGVLSQTLGWEYVFLVNLPVGVAGIIALAIAMPARTEVRSHKVDYAGGALLSAAVTMTVYWAEQVLTPGSNRFVVYGLPPLIVAALIGFVAVERRASEPIVPLSLLRERTIALTLGIGLVVGVATLGMLNYFALFLQTVTGAAPAIVGLLFVPASIGSMVSSIGSGFIISRTGRYKIFPVIGIGLGVFVMLSFLWVEPQTPYWVLGMMMASFAICMGLQMQTLIVAVQNAAPYKDVGAATGAITLARMIGASLGLAANGGLLHAALARAQAALPADVAAALPVPAAELTPTVIATLPPQLGAIAVNVFSDAFASVFYSGAILFAVGFVLALLLKDVRLPTHAKHAPAEGAATAGD